LSYRGFQSYRHYINSKLHGLSVRICGGREVLDEEIYKILNSRELKPAAQDSLSGLSGTASVSTTMLSDQEAHDLYRRLCKVASKVSANIKGAKQIIGNDDAMTDGQRKAIIRLSKYGFSWPPEAIFSFILYVVPEKRKRLSPWEIQNSKLQRLFGLLSKKDADRVIKRLDRIKKRNSKQ